MDGSCQICQTALLGARGSEASGWQKSNAGLSGDEIVDTICPCHLRETLKVLKDEGGNVIHHSWEGNEVERAQELRSLRLKAGNKFTAEAARVPPKRYVPSAESC